MKCYRKIIEIGNSLGVTVPKALIAEDLKKGDWVKVEVKKVR